MSANRQQSGTAYLGTYEFVDDRIAAFRADYPGLMGRIESIPMHSNDMCIWEARISLRDADNSGEYLMIANGHAYDKWGAASQAERTEKAAIGRALVMAGYSAKRGASDEEMQRHADQERNGAAMPGRTSGAHASQTPHNGPTANETAKKAQPPAPAKNRTPDGGYVLWDNLPQGALRPAYAEVIGKARGMVADGMDEETIKAYLGSKKRAMSDDEYQDALFRFGEIQTMIADRDVEAEVRAELVTASVVRDGVVGADSPEDVDF